MGLVDDPTGNTLTYQIIGAAMAVHNRLGPGYKEEIYERALANECGQSGLCVALQVPIPVCDLGLEVGLFYLDLLVDSVVVVEVKAFSHLLTGDEIAQVINYLTATDLKVGLLINFGSKSLEFKRLINTKFKSLNWD
jgi:GxxExxY protein